MSPSLRDFVSKAVEHDRILFGDLRRLQRDILPARITTREEAEALIALDRVRRADRAWRAYPGRHHQRLRGVGLEPGGPH